VSDVPDRRRRRSFSSGFRIRRNQLIHVRSVCRLQIVGLQTQRSAAVLPSAAKISAHLGGHGTDAEKFSVPQCGLCPNVGTAFRLLSPALFTAIRRGRSGADQELPEHRLNSLRPKNPFHSVQVRSTGQGHSALAALNRQAGSCRLRLTLLPFGQSSVACCNASSHTNKANPLAVLCRDLQDATRTQNSLFGIRNLRKPRELSQPNQLDMVGERGFEPPTPWSRTRCSTRLSHSPTCAGR
jgi:hypothetical protein